MWLKQKLECARTVRLEPLRLCRDGKSFPCGPSRLGPRMNTVEQIGAEPQQGVRPTARRKATLPTLRRSKADCFKPGRWVACDNSESSLTVVKAQSQCVHVPAHTEGTERQGQCVTAWKWRTAHQLPLSTWSHGAASWGWGWQVSPWLGVICHTCSYQSPCTKERENGL